MSENLRECLFCRGEDIDSVVKFYREYYKRKRITMKRGFTCKNREEPDWLSM